MPEEVIYLGINENKENAENSDDVIYDWIVDAAVSDLKECERGFGHAG